MLVYLFMLAALTLAPNGGVLDNDTDPDGDAVVSAVLVTTTQHGTLDFNPDGTFTYTPNADFHGTDGFLYAPVDETGMQGEPTTVTITVNPVGDPPVGVPDAYETDEDMPLVVPPPVTFEGSAFNGNTLTAPAEPGNVASWSFVTATAPGTYRISATWPPTQRAASKAEYIVIADGMQTPVTVDQRKPPAGFEADGSVWQELTVQPADNAIVVLLRGEEPGTLLVADAVRIERVENDANRKTLPGVQTRHAVAGNARQPGSLRAVRASRGSAVVADRGGSGRNEQGP